MQHYYSSNMLVESNLLVSINVWGMQSARCKMQTFSFVSAIDASTTANESFILSLTEAIPSAVLNKK